MEKVNELVKSIKGSNPRGGSKKDEARVMRAMLNDKSFVVGVYSDKGKESEYCPAEVATSLVRDIVANATKISKNEATEIANNYEFTNADASKFVNISKEFVNVYTDTGRKLNLGRRENSNSSLFKKEIAAHEKQYTKIVTNANGDKVYERGVTNIPSYTALRVVSRCPKHLK